MLSVNTEVHLTEKVALEAADCNGLMRKLRPMVRELELSLYAEQLEQVQEEHLERVFRGEEEITCTRCGLVHTSSKDLVRRGWRSRSLRSRSGKIHFRLRQLTCRGCGRTWSPYPAILGLRPRQRVLEEVSEALFEGVTELSYRKTCRLGSKWLGASLSPKTLHGRVQEKGEELQLTPDPDGSVVVADGTKIPAGERDLGADVRVGLQVLGREEHGRRRRARLRATGLGVGNESWAEALPETVAPKLVVSDGEPALAAHVRGQYPDARHQLCQWHAVHTLEWSLIEDEVAVEDRRAIQKRLASVLFREESAQKRRRRYRQLLEELEAHTTAHRQLEHALPKLIYDRASEEQTTSLAEREMREVNRRMENGAHWSEPGAKNLLGLRLAQRHNPDDYARLWS